MKTIKLLITILTISGMLSCSKDKPGIVDEQDTETNEYIVGYVRKGINSRQPALWKNGILTILESAENQNTRAMKVAVQGNDVYVLGSERSTNGFSRSSTILLWKNNAVTPITDGSIKAEPLQLIVDKGNVFVLGSETDQSEGSADASYKYWKNGVPTVLNTRRGGATEMTVVNGDVYVSGYEENENHRMVAKYWKNGVPISVSDGVRDAYAESISVEGAEIAVLFTQDNAASGNDLKVWESGTTSLLLGGAYRSEARKVIIKDHITHVLSNQRHGPSDEQHMSERVVYYRDGVKTDITNGSVYAKDGGMVVKDNDVYIALYEDGPGDNNQVKLSKNGTVKTIVDDYERMAETLFITGSNQYILGNTYREAYLWKNGVEAIIHPNGFAADMVVTGN